MKFLINTKVGLNRGSKRVWLEGIRLLKAGFNAGDTIDVAGAATDQIKITRNPTATKIVSRRKKGDSYLPLIEITGSKLDAFSEGESVRVLISPKGIIITRTTRAKAHTAMLDGLVSRIRNKEPLRALSVFHGGGVLDQAVHTGMDEAGIKTKIGLAIEAESKYINSSILNNGNLFDEDSIIIESAVESVNAFSNDTYDIAVMGIPCSGASLAGITKNKLSKAEDHKSAGHLFHDALNYAMKAPIVLIENVVPYLKTVSFQVIESALKAQDYTVQVKILNGNEFGAIENRDRICAVAMLNELAEYFDIDDIVPDEVCQPPMISEILEEIPEESIRWKKFQYLIDKEIRDKAAGKGFARTIVDGSERKCGTIGRLYHKCRSTETYVQAKFSDVTRLFTPTEHARIKTIPERLIAGQSDTTAHEILGQSIVFNAFLKAGKVIGDAVSSFANDYSLANPIKA